MVPNDVMFLGRTDKFKTKTIFIKLCIGIIIIMLDLHNIQSSKVFRIPCPNNKHNIIVLVTYDFRTISTLFHTFQFYRILINCVYKLLL